MTDKETALAEHKEKVKRNRIVKPTFWKYATLILLVALIFSVYTNAGSSPVVMGEDPDAVDNAIDFINENLLFGLATAELMEVTDEGAVYKLDLKIETLEGESEEYVSFVSKDGRYVFPAGVELVQEEPEIIEVEETEEEAMEETVEEGAEETEERMEMGVTEDGDPILGDPSSPVIVTEYSDFECPFCEQAYWTLKLVEESYVGQVAIVFKNFPLTEIHPEAQKAAEAGECALDQGMFWEYHDMLFENQDALAVDDLKQYAADLGMDTEVFDECLDSGEKEVEVALDVSAGKQDGVGSTPTFFINDEMLVGAEPFSSFQEIIDQELEAAGVVEETLEDDTTADNSTA